MNCLFIRPLLHRAPLNRSIHTNNLVSFLSSQIALDAAAIVRPPPPVQPRDRNVHFVRSRSTGQRFLILDQQWRYTEHTENAMLVFWKCHEARKSHCPAEVATTKNETVTRVVVINDTHIHKRRKVFETIGVAAAGAGTAKEVPENVSSTGTAVTTDDEQQDTTNDNDAPKLAAPIEAKLE